MSQDIMDYYGKAADEDSRVRTISRFEYARTKEIIGRYLAAGPLTVLAASAWPGAIRAEIIPGFRIAEAKR